jgi:hypothetical protein
VLNKKTAFRLWGTIGGFGIGNSSEYTWEWGFITSFLVTEWFGFHVGYRMLQYKRDSGGIDTKLTMRCSINWARSSGSLLFGEVRRIKRRDVLAHDADRLARRLRRLLHAVAGVDDQFRLRTRNV